MIEFGDPLTQHRQQRAAGGIVIGQPQAERIDLRRRCADPLLERRGGVAAGAAEGGAGMIDHREQRLALRLDAGAGWHQPRRRHW